MGKVAVTYRIFPGDAEVDVVRLASSVRGALGASVRDVAVRPVAFGLKALEATVIVDDAAGQAELVETRLQAIPGVGQVETLGISLL